MATIIRKDRLHETNSGNPVEAVAFSFADMRGQASDYLTTVREEAAKIIQQAHQQAEQLRRHAEVAGRQAAERAIEQVLEDKVAERLKTVVPALQQIVHELEQTKGELVAQWERSAIQVATAIAGRIVRREIEREPQITLDSISEALRLAIGATEITLHVNPKDLEDLAVQIGRLAETLCQLAPSQIVADERITQGGCRIITKRGEIDQQIETQLKRIEEDLA